MTLVLLIETATKVCSVALANSDEIIALREDKSMQYSHSTQLTGFIEEVIQQGGYSFSDLDAVAVSKGPGSYTGLRIGVSAAKGFCYGLEIPLLAVNTLDAMAHVARKKIEETEFFVPMIDARRMEVYNAVFSSSLQNLRETRAEIITENAFDMFLEKAKVAFFGDGAPKCKELLNHKHALFFDDLHPSAAGMHKIALENFQNEKYEDTAYFEPFYLKDFVAGKPKVKGLR